MSDDKSVLPEWQHLKCPHWDNDYHQAWKEKSGFMNLELTPPGEPEWSLYLCPICANLVRARVFEEMLVKTLGANTPQWNEAIRKRVDWILGEKREDSTE
jgi:hypothetical protein